MKKLLTAILILISISAAAQEPKKDSAEKIYKISLTESHMQALWAVMEFSKQNLPASQAKGLEIQNVLNVTQQLQQLIAVQYKEQQPKDIPKK